MPSLYESTVNTGEVSSSNFTTLYNASGLAVPNAGAGSVTGNLNVGGNLTVQGNSLLIGEVTLQSTLSLPNYTFPLPDGTTDQVLVTDGNGNLYWTDVSAIPGADYSISATSVAGGANITLENTAGFVDSVKLAAGNNMSIVRTDANTITIATVADNIPDGTAAGELLVWDGSAWTANNEVRSTAAADRLVTELYSTNKTISSSLRARRNFASSAYTTGDSTGIAYQVASDSQTPVTIGLTGFSYDAANPSFLAVTSTDNFTSDRLAVAVINSITVGFDGTNLVLNNNLSGAPTENATFAVKRGSSTDATITWDETDDRWELNYDLIAPGLQGANIQVGLGADNEIYIGGQDLLLNTGSGLNNIQSNSPIKTSAESMTINSDSTAADSYLYMKGNTEYLKWDNTNTRFELSDQLYISQTDPAAILERRTPTADISTNESKTSLRLYTRVTDAPNNNTVNTGAGIVFGRTSGATDPTEKLYGGIATVWNGTENKVITAFNWTNDNYTEVSPGVFPETYDMLRVTSKESKFFNNSLYVDYNVITNTETATSITGGNTLVFGSAHGYTAGQRLVFQSATQNGLKLSSYYYVSATGLTATQCQVSLTFGGPSVPLTNGTGLTLTFAEFTNRVGVNTDAPGYTLDVAGDTNVQGLLTVQADAVTINSDKTDQDVYLNFGRVAPSANAAIRWNKTTNSFEWSEDGSTWHDFIDATITNPQQGQFLTYDAASTEWINSSLIEFNNTTYRPRFEANTGINGRTQSGAAVTNNTGAVNYTTGDGASILMGVDSDAQSTTFAGSVSAAYNTSGDHEVRLSSSTNNFASDQATSITGGNTLVFTTAHGFAIGDKLTYAGSTQNGLVYGTNYYVISSGFTTTQCQVSLTLGGSAVALTNGTGLSLWFYNGVSRLLTATNAEVDISAPKILLNSTNTGVAFTGTAGIEVERGTSGANQTFVWTEANNFWRASSDLYVDNFVIGGVGLATNGNNIIFNNDNASPAGTSNLLVKSGVSTGVDANFRWNDSTKRWQDTIDGSTYYNLPNQNLDTNSIVNFSAVVLDGRATFDTGATTTTSTATFSIDQTDRNAIKAMVYMSRGTDSHAVEVMIMRTPTDAMITTYGEMYTTTPLATFTADQSGGFIRIRCTPTSATSTTFSVVRYSLT